MLAACCALQWAVAPLGAQSTGAQSTGSQSTGNRPAKAGGRILDRLLDTTLERAQAGVEEASDIWEDHSTWENAWEVRARHYLVRTTHSYGLARALADGQEVMLGHFAGVLGDGVVRSEPLVIHVRPDVGAYNSAGEEFGDQHSSFYGSFFAATGPGAPVEVAYTDNRTWLQMQITHSAFHQFVALAHPGSQLPSWVEEGLASYFSLYWNQAWGAQELARAREVGPKLDPSLLARQSMSQDPAEAHHLLIQLGMFFGWLMDHRPDTRIVRDDAGQPTGGPMLEVIRAMLDGETQTVLLRLLAGIGEAPELMAEFEAYDFGG